MDEQCNYPLCESRSAHHNLKVTHLARWRLFADMLFAPANRMHRYRDVSRRMLETALDKHDCRNPCR